MELNPMCKRDIALWMMLSPLIFFHAVEYDLPHRVMRQFGKLQATTPMVFSTDMNLHGYRHTDWGAYHRVYLLEWENRANRSRDAPPIHQKTQFVRYLQWLQSVARLRLRLAMTDADIEEGHSSEEDIVDDYAEFTRTGTQPNKAPINAYYGTQLARISNEVGEALMLPEGSEGIFQRLRDFAEMVRRWPQ